MKLFPILNNTMLQQEQREGYGSWDARMWPSEASAVREDQRESKIAGKCHRASFGRLVGWTITNKTDVVSARRFRAGRLLEGDIVQLAKDSGVFVANGVRVTIHDEETGLMLPLELDLVALDVESKRLGICENKTVYGWGAKKIMDGGEPKIEGLMQTVIYKNEFPTGAILKQVILEGYARKLELEKQIAELKAEGADPASYARLQRELDRNRIEVDLEKLAEASDGPVWTNMLYETRDDCRDREFEIEIIEDDGLHWPSVEGIPTKLFSVESIYDRYAILKSYYDRAKEEGMRRAARAGFLEPSIDAPYREVNAYREAVLFEMKKLGPEYWPPAEYEWRYTEQKIEMLYAAKLIAKTPYEKWKRRGKGFKWFGDWACNFCNFKQKCLSLEYPELAHLMADLDVEEEQQEAA